MSSIVFVLGAVFVGLAFVLVVFRLDSCASGVCFELFFQCSSTSLQLLARVSFHMDNSAGYRLRPRAVSEYRIKTSCFGHSSPSMIILYAGVMVPMQAGLLLIAIFGVSC